MPSRSRRRAGSRMLIARRAAPLALDPSFAIAQLTIGNILNETGWPERAIAHYRKAAALDPHFTEAVASEGRSLMLMGDMESGWAKMEMRDYDKKRFAGAPRWQGEKVRHLLLYAEQGIGDIVHFLRYIPLIRDRAETISLQAPASLRCLIAAHMPEIAIIAPADPLPPADAHTLLMSLPYFCGTTLATIPPCRTLYMRSKKPGARRGGKGWRPCRSRISVSYGWGIRSTATITTARSRSRRSSPLLAARKAASGLAAKRLDDGDSFECLYFRCRCRPHRFCRNRRIAGRA